jgi:hypothetical protein
MLTVHRTLRREVKEDPKRILAVVTAGGYTNAGVLHLSFLSL